jgi:hypothetical protein
MNPRPYTRALQCPPHVGSGIHSSRVERTSAGSDLIEVLDRVLHKGIVIDAWVRVCVVGIDLMTVEARVVVSSIETHLRYSATDYF